MEERPRLGGRVSPIAFLAVCAALFSLVSSNPYHLRLMTSGALYALLATGLNVPLGQAGLLDMGYVGFFAVGAYVRALLASPQLGIHLPFAATVIASLIAAATLALVFGVPTLRLKGDYLAIVTMSFSEILRITLTNLDRPVNVTNGPNGVISIDPPSWGALVLDSPKSQFYLVLSFAVAGYVVYSALESSRVGIRWRAIKDDAIAAESFGVDVAFYRVLAFVVGAAYASVAGVLFASWQGAVFPQNFTLYELITLYCMVVLGGPGNRDGVVAAACILVLVPELLRSYSVYRMLIYGAALVLIQLVRVAGTSRARGAARPPTGEARARSSFGRSQLVLRASRIKSAAEPSVPLQPSAKEPGGMAPSPVLSVKEVSHKFGGLEVLRGVSFDLARGEVLGIIGPNGSGKTTLANIICGITKPASGICLFEGQPITGMRPHAVYRKGLARTFQNVRLFDTMTVQENVLLGATGPVSLDADLVHKAHKLAGSLSYPERKSLEIARATAGAPKVILLDEPSAGMSQEEASRLTRTIRDLRSKGISVVLIEHRMSLIMDACDRVLVLDRGRKIAEGPPLEVAADPKVAEVYLGGGEMATDARRAQGTRRLALPNDRLSAETEAAPPARPVLRLEQLEASYGSIQVLRGVSLEVHAGEVVCLLGANGAGKTTVFKAIMGGVSVSRGRMEFLGRDLLGEPTGPRKGLSISPEGRRVFSRMTVEENLEAGAVFEPTDEVRERLARVYALFPRLLERRWERAGTLSGGEQQMLAIGRALMASPKLLLLDEPSMGLAPIAAQGIFRAIRSIADSGVGVLLVEQNLVLAMSVADRAYVVQNGAIVMEGQARELSREAVEDAYLRAGLADQES